MFNRRGVSQRVKHLNPRQGITTAIKYNVLDELDGIGVKHLNPRQGITTGLRFLHPAPVRAECETPKSPPGDYNSASSICCCSAASAGVKHLNPRQGITT